eukprot:7078678-Prymnesium_polylepis.2
MPGQGRAWHRSSASRSPQLGTLAPPSEWQEGPVLRVTTGTIDEGGGDGGAARTHIHDPRRPAVGTGACAGSLRIEMQLSPRHSSDALVRMCRAWMRARRSSAQTMLRREPKCGWHARWSLIPVGCVRTDFCRFASLCANSVSVS